MTNRVISRGVTGVTKREWRNKRKKSLYDIEDDLGFIYRKYKYDKLEAEQKMEERQVMTTKQMDEQQQLMEEEHVIHSVPLEDVQPDLVPMELPAGERLSDEMLAREASANSCFKRFLRDFVKFLKENDATKEIAMKLEENLQYIFEEDKKLFAAALDEHRIESLSANARVLTKQIEKCQAEIKEWDRIMESFPDMLKATLSSDDVASSESALREVLTDEQKKILDLCVTIDDEDDPFAGHAVTRLTSAKEMIQQNLESLQLESDNLIEQLEVYKNDNILPYLQLQDTPRRIAKGLISTRTQPIQTPY